MFAPVPDQLDGEKSRAQRDQAISGFDWQLVLHDQRDQADGQQQERQPPEAAPVMMSVMMVMHVMVAPSAARTAARLPLTPK